MGSTIIFLLSTSFTDREEVDFSDIEKANMNLRKRKVFFLGWVVEYDPKSVSIYYEHHDKFTWVSPTWYQ